MTALAAYFRNRRRLTYLVLIIACLVIGLVSSLALYDQSLGLGDTSTFYAFATNVSRGEVPFKDFIHFRTPGTIWLQAISIGLFGPQQSSVTLAISAETVLFYPLLFVIAGILLVKNKKNPWLAVLAYLGVAFLPGVAQLRAGFGLLAVACYLCSFENDRHKKLYLWAAGILMGVTFTFGQEVALMVLVIFAAGELIKYKKAELKARLKIILPAIAVGVLPIMLYMLIFSSLSTFIYYVTYYSFVIQPKFMNTPFPALGYASFIFYLPFILYALCFLALYFSSKLGKKEALLLGFGILRLITSLGRADIGHLIFSIPEIFLIVPYFMYSLLGQNLKGQRWRKFAPYGLGLIALFVLAMEVNSVFLVATPFLLVWAVIKRDEQRTTANRKSLTTNNFMLLGAGLAVFVFILFPYYASSLRQIKIGLADNSTSGLRVGGVKIDPISYREIQAVSAVVKPLKPNTIFAFPIQAFYYSLAPHHASPYMTFEPQTTLSEQDKTIADLKRTRPEVIIFDPLQAHGLSGSLWKISNYITTNYQLKSEIQDREILWVMVPKAEPAREEKLAFQLFKDNKTKGDNLDIQSSAQGLNNAFAQINGSAHFFVDVPSGGNLSLSVPRSPGVNVNLDCGQVKIVYDASKSTETKVCHNQGQVSLPLMPDKDGIEVIFYKPSGGPFIWNDPTVTN